MVQKGPAIFSAKLIFIYLIINYLRRYIAGSLGLIQVLIWVKIGCFLVYYGSSRYNIQQIFSK
jgi:hypothetical protein